VPHHWRIRLHQNAAKIEPRKHMDTTLMKLPTFSTALLVLGIGCTLVSGCQSEQGKFTIAVIPDTQKLMDFTHQKAVGFAIDSAEMFIEEMQYIADNAVSQGGDIAFVASVGDV
jgi:hypothetical protein